MVKLREQQQSALYEVIIFLQDDTRQVFVLSGYAGTGKTTILQCLEQEGLVFAAPTHKAKRVLASKMGEDTVVETVASILGLRPDLDLRDFDPQNPQFSINPSLIKHTKKPLIIDEASMVNTKLHDVLLEYFPKILFVGDKSQLPPVGEDFSAALDHEGVNLTEIIRTDDTNILEIAGMVRAKEVVPEELKAYKEPDGEGIVLCYTNKRVRQWNKQFHPELMPKKGDKMIMCRTIGSGDYTKIHNSEVVEIEYIENKSNGILNTLYVETDKHVDFYIVKPESYERYYIEYSKRLKRAKANRRLWKDFYEFINKYILIEKYKEIKPTMDYTFASTIHKSQGSTYETVYIDNDLFGQDYWELLYVAVTRASHNLYWINNGRKVS